MTGGFVCGKSLTRDLNAKELADAPHPPLTDGPLPYQYGLNLTTGTPLYRRKVTREERKQYEHGLPVGKSDGKGRVGRIARVGRRRRHPWYLKEGARKQVSLNDLQSREGPVVERMVRGFYLSLDKRVGFYAGRFWKTAAGLLRAGRAHRRARAEDRVRGGPRRRRPTRSASSPSASSWACTRAQYRFVEGDGQAASAATTSTASPSSASPARRRSSRTATTSRRPTAGGCATSTAPSPGRAPPPPTWPPARSGSTST